MVKVEMRKDEVKNIIALAFESSNSEDLEILDAVRVALMGTHEKRYGYVNSRRLIVEVKQ